MVRRNRSRVAEVLAVCALALPLTSVSALAQGAGGGGGAPAAGGGADAPTPQPDRTRQRQREEGDGQRAGGQGGFGGMGGGMGRMLEPGVSKREIDSYAKSLTLSDEQKEVVATLFDAYQQEFAETARAAREKMEAMREEMRESGGADWAKFGEAMETFRKSRQAKETAFFSDIKAVLNEQQAAKWPSIERTRRREQTVGRGLMSGERVDVIRLVNELELPEAQRAALNATLEQYETDLDRELQTRNQVYEDAQGKMREIFQSGDPTAMQEIFDKGRAASQKVRDVNTRYARQVESLLDDSARAKFSQGVKRESFPMIYRPSYASRVVDAAVALPDLDDSQKTAITTIKESFTREVGTLNTSLEKASIAREESIKPEDMMRRGGGGGGMDSDEMRDLRDKRRELETSTIEKIKALLKEEQVAKLPEREGRGGPGGGEGDAPQRRRPRGADGERPASAPDSRL